MLRNVKFFFNDRRREWYKLDYQARREWNKFPTDAYQTESIMNVDRNIDEVMYYLSRKNGKKSPSYWTILDLILSELWAFVLGLRLCGHLTLVEATTPALDLPHLSVCCFCLFTGKIYVGIISVYSSTLGHICVNAAQPQLSAWPFYLWFAY